MPALLQCVINQLNQFFESKVVCPFNRNFALGIDGVGRINRVGKAAGKEGRGGREKEQSNKKCTQFIFIYVNFMLSPINRALKWRILYRQELYNAPQMRFCTIRPHR